MALRQSICTAGTFCDSGYVVGYMVSAVHSRSELFDRTRTPALLLLVYTRIPTSIFGEEALTLILHIPVSCISGYIRVY